MHAEGRCSGTELFVNQKANCELSYGQRTAILRRSRELGEDRAAATEVFLVRHVIEWPAQCYEPPDLPPPAREQRCVADASAMVRSREGFSPCTGLRFRAANPDSAQARPAGPPPPWPPPDAEAVLVVPLYEYGALRRPRRKDGQGTDGVSIGRGAQAACRPAASAWWPSRRSAGSGASWCGPLKQAAVRSEGGRRWRPKHQSPRTGAWPTLWLRKEPSIAEREMMS